MNFDESYDAWLAKLDSLGFAVASFLNPPTAQSTLDSVEKAVGFDLPQDFKSLYLKADGQVPPFGLQDAAPGKVVTPFFGSYDFVSLEKALFDYNMWLDIHDQAGPDFHTDFDHCTVRAGDAVHGDYWRPGWLPFAIVGGGNAYAVDLSPPDDGIYGQVILIGSDEDERRVLAPSICKMLASAALLDIEFKESEGIWRCFDIERL